MQNKNLTPINGTLFSTPLRGISALTKLFSAEKTQKIVSNLLMRRNIQKFKIDQDIRSLSEVRNGMATFIKQVHDTKRSVVITQRGKGVAVLIDAHEFEAMQD